MTQWANTIIEQFEIVDLHTTEESDFFGPFNSLLSDLFPASEHYMVSPQTMRIGELDFIFQSIVRTVSSRSCLLHPDQDFRFS